MNGSWLAELNQIENGKNPSLHQLQKLRQELEQALNKRDWPYVGRIDRLCAQVVKRLETSGVNEIQEIVGELVEIKKLYNRSLFLIEQQLSKLSNQAY